MATEDLDQGSYVMTRRVRISTHTYQRNSHGLNGGLDQGDRVRARQRWLVAWGGRPLRVCAVGGRRRRLDSVASDERDAEARRYRGDRAILHPDERDAEARDKRAGEPPGASRAGLGSFGFDACSVQCARRHEEFAGPWEPTRGTVRRPPSAQPGRSKAPAGGVQVGVTGSTRGLVATDLNAVGGLGPKASKPGVGTVAAEFGPAGGADLIAAIARQQKSASQVFVLFCSVLFCSVLFRSVLFCSVLLGAALLCSTFHG